MGVLQTISGYFKQLTGEIIGSQTLADDGRREVAGRPPADSLTRGNERAPVGAEASERHRSKVDTMLDARPTDETGMPTVTRREAMETDAMDVAAADLQHPADASTVRADADPQFRVSHAGATNDGVSSAKPRVITGSDDATANRQPPGQPASMTDWSADFDETAPRLDREGSVPHEQLSLYRLVPADPYRDNAQSHGEIVVRARSSADARMVAAEAEMGLRDSDASPAGDRSALFGSAFSNERLYTVVDEPASTYPAAGPREVVAGRVHDDDVRPRQV